MYETLKALSIRLDAPAQSLTKDAIAQMLVKILYKNPNSMSRNEILDEFKSIVGWDDARKEEMLEILDNLKFSEIQFSKGRFYLSSAKRAAIDKLKTESEDRFQYVIDTYFKPYSSNDEAIKTWLQQALIIFFANYSKDWIANLCYDKSAILNNIEQVMEQIGRFTCSYKSIERSDRESLLKSFRDILTINDPLLAPLMWEYGTSQFVAQLLKNGNKIDKLTVEVFNGATCLIDTNILFHLALNGNEYSSRLKSIERIFNALGIKVRYLNITKTEYLNTIGTKIDEITALFDKEIEIDVIEEADNQLIQSGQSLGCRTRDDYERFFKGLLTVPSVIENTVMVSLLDDDPELDQVIIEAQNDENKISQLNAAYKSFTHKDKRPHALTHDIGLIEGSRHLRKGGKYFILTQDSSIINYSKQYPFMQGLPISIKIETLLNVLAVNSFNNSCEDYIPLFASIIREGLQPKATTFKIEDLHYIIEKEGFIGQLPKESVISIVKEVSQKRLLGEPDESISKELTRQIEREKFKVARDLESTKLQLSCEKSAKEKASQDNQKGKDALIKTWTDEKNKDIDKAIRHEIYSGIFSSIGILILIALILFFKQLFFGKSIPLWVTIISAIAIDVATTLWAWIKNFIPNIHKLRKGRNKAIQDYIEEKLIEIYG